MQSKTTWGVRHLLVSTGVISLVLSVAAPAALADKPEAHPDAKNEHADNEETGAERIEICHNGRVIEVDDDGLLGGHSKHGDGSITHAEDEEEARGACIPPTGDSPLEGDELVELCLDGELDEVFQSERTADHADPVLNEDDELTCPGEIIPGGGDKVQVCHEGSVIEIAVEALEKHLGHGDAEMVEGATCPVIVDEKVEDIDIDPVVLDDPEVVVEVPVENPPATPVQPIPAAQPRPVVIISTDTVTKPAVEQNEVLGAVTTRTPTPGVGALDPGTHTAASITALAATGADGTKVLAVAGVVLLLSGFGLQLSGRRRMRSAMVEA
ncbi:MAG: hypothetical protein ACLGIZ_05610 [Acidimicrobiia bacterium]|jgi:hypothetical protein